ncbi:hypothetical protein ACWEIJ_13140 [Lentzea sp. NPDC004789]
MGGVAPPGLLVGCGVVVDGCRVALGGAEVPGADAPDLGDGGTMPPGTEVAGRDAGLAGGEVVPVCGVDPGAETAGFGACVTPGAGVAPGRALAPGTGVALGRGVLPETPTPGFDAGSADSPPAAGLDPAAGPGAATGCDVGAIFGTVFCTGPGCAELGCAVEPGAGPPGFAPTPG